MLNRFRQMTISRQLFITAGLSIVLFSVSLTAATSFLIAQQLRQNAVEDARLHARLFAERSLFAFLVDDETVAEDAISQTTAFPQIDNAVLIRTNGDKLGHKRTNHTPEFEHLAFASQTSIEENDAYWVAVEPVLTNPALPTSMTDGAKGERLGVAAIAYSKAPYRNAIQTIWIINAIAGIIATAVTLFLLSYQMRILTDPLRSLSAAMGAGTSVRSPQRADLAGPQEVREIAEVYNALAAAVQKSHAALESEVVIRTEELRVARDAALSASRQKSEIMAAVTHEMKTPLQAISGYAQLTLEELEFALDENAAQNSREQVLNILARARELLARITQMLDLARAEAGKFDLRLEDTNIGALLEAAVASVAPLAADRNNAIETQLKDCEDVLIDAEKLHQIVINLLSNACKFTRGGRIIIRCKLASDSLDIAVEDTGIGIAPENLGLIFEPFRQVDMSPQRPYAGTGLGLAVTREFVNLLGGEISVASTLEVGSTFRVVIPLPIELHS